MNREPLLTTKLGLPSSPVDLDRAWQHTREIRLDTVTRDYQQLYTRFLLSEVRHERQRRGTLWICGALAVIAVAGWCMACHFWIVAGAK